MPPYKKNQYEEADQVIGPTEKSYVLPNNQVVGGAVTSSVLAPQSEIPFSSPQSVPLYPVAGLSDVSSGLTLTEPEKQAQSSNTKLQELNKRLIGESAFRAEQETAQNIPQLTQTQNDLASRLKTLANEASAIPLQLQQESIGRGITAGGLRPIETAALRNNAIQALSTKSLLEASRGNLDTALTLVDRAVKQKYDPIREEITATEKNLQLILNSPEFSLADKRRAQVQLDIQERKKRELAKQERDAKDIHEIAIAALKNGADSLTLSVITNASTPGEALQELARSGFALSPDTQIVNLDNGNTLLVDKRNGNIIKNYGGAKAPEGIPGENPQLYSGLSSATATAVRSKVGAFKSEPMVQNFATLQEGYNFSKTLSDTTTNPADDQALIYALAKALDPGSVVREGEYATAQKYAQSWISAYGKGVEQALAGTGFLSSSARSNIKKVIEQKYNASKTSYDNLYGNYAKSINSLTGRGNGQDFLVDYAIKEKYQPGEIIHSGGVMYQVEDDGETIIPIGSSAI